MSRIEKLNSGKASVVSLEKQLDQAVEFSNDLIERSSSSDIIQDKNNVEERIEDLIKISASTSGHCNKRERAHYRQLHTFDYYE